MAITVAVTLPVGAFPRFTLCGFTGAMSYRREVHHMDTISLCVSILSLVVSAISLGVALGGNKK